MTLTYSFNISAIMFKYLIESINLGRMSLEIKEAPKFFDLFIDNKLVLWTCYTIKLKKKLAATLYESLPIIYRWMSPETLIWHLLWSSVLGLIHSVCVLQKLALKYPCGAKTLSSANHYVCILLLTIVKLVHKKYLPNRS